MPVIEPLAVLPDPVHTDLEALAKEQLGVVAVAHCAVNGVHDKLPVHDLLAVEEMAPEDEAQSFVLSFVGLDYAEFELLGERS